MKPDQSMSSLLNDIKTCRHCIEHLPHAPRPVLQIHPEARILIAGQAPGRKVHASGIPFDDASGKRLREWLGVDSTSFYDPSLFAILPMAFCYPGSSKSGDLRPDPRCAHKWRKQVLHALPNIQTTILLGQYAHNWHLGTDKKANLTETVFAWREYYPDFFPMPHPSPRNNGWLKQNPWFIEKVIPALQDCITQILAHD